MYSAFLFSPGILALCRVCVRMVRFVYLHGTLNTLYQPEEEGKAYRYYCYPWVEPVVASLTIFQRFSNALEVGVASSTASSSRTNRSRQNWNRPRRLDGCPGRKWPHCANVLSTAVCVEFARRFSDNHRLVLRSDSGNSRASVSNVSSIRPSGKIGL